MATAGTESVSIESSYVYFGTVRFGVMRPTVVQANHLTVNVQDMNSPPQRVSIQIAFKHICKALLCRSGQQKALAFLVNRFCAGKIRESLQIATVPEATIGNSAPYFDSESARICQRYILVDITKCNANDMNALDRVMHVVEESRLLLKAENNAKGMLMNATSSGDFFGDMDENDFVNLMRDIGLNVGQVSGNVPNLESRLTDNGANAGISSVNTAAASSQLSPAYAISNHRRPLSSIRSQGTVTIRTPVVQQQRNIYYQPSSAPRVITVTQHRPVNVNIVRVVPCQNSTGTSYVSSPMQVSFGRGASTAPSVTSQRNMRISLRSAPKRISVITQASTPTRTAKQQLSNSQSAPNVTGNEPSTSTSSQEPKGMKRVVHVIDDDDDEAGSSTPTKEPRLDLLLNYPRDQPNSIPVHYADVEYLRPNELLNDTIIEFYLKYIHMELVPPERRSSIFIFSPFFYSRLTQMPQTGPSVIRTAASRAKWIAENYKRVRTWTKNVDIFNADYIVVPIVEDIHWYLAIITFPRFAIMDRNPVADQKEEEDKKSMPKRMKKTRIIILDSLADASDIKRKLTVHVLREYLVCEYEDKRKAKDQDTKYIAKERVEKIVPIPVPQQRNYTDCGLFLLKFAECFLLKPPTFITRNDSFKRWYPNFTIRGMRRSILAKLKSACDEEVWRAYEEYSRNNSQPIEAALPEMPSNTRSPSPMPRRRTQSTSDSKSNSNSDSCVRRRSVPPENRLC